MILICSVSTLLAALPIAYQAITPTINLDCEFTEKASSKTTSFSINPPGSLFKGYALTKGDFTFGFKLEGALILYKLISKIEGKNTHLSQKNRVKLSGAGGYSLKNNMLDMSSDEVSLHCDAITSKNSIFD